MLRERSSGKLLLEPSHQFDVEADLIGLRLDQHRNGQHQAGIDACQHVDLGG